MKKDIRKHFYITIAATLFCSTLCACSASDILPVSLGHDAPPIITDLNDPVPSEPIVIATNEDNPDESIESTENDASDNTPEEDPGDAIENEKDILLVYRRFNAAWGREDHGYIIDTNGNLYEFDFSKEPVIGPNNSTDKNDPNAYENKVREVLENNTGTPFMDKETVEKIQQLGKNVSQDDEFDLKYKMCDYGQNTIYFYNPDTKELIMCESEGDVLQTSHNKDANEIAKLYRATFGKITE